MWWKLQCGLWEQNIFLLSFKKSTKLCQENRSSIPCDLGIHCRSVNQSKGKDISAFNGIEKIGDRRSLATMRFYWVRLRFPRLLSINAFLTSRVIRFSLSLFPVNPSRGEGKKKRHPGRREKSLSRGGERPSRPTSWNGDGEEAVKRGCRWINRGGGSEQDRPKDGVLWGFHGWCSRKFAYRASVTSPLAPAPGHSRLGISPGADLRDNGDHSYGKSDGGRGRFACDSVPSHLKKLPGRAARDITLGFGKWSRTSSRSTRIRDEIIDLG